MSPDEAQAFLAELFEETLLEFRESPSIDRFKKQFLEACVFYEKDRGYSPNLVRAETAKIVQATKTVVKRPKSYLKNPLSSQAIDYKVKIGKQYERTIGIVRGLSSHTLSNLSYRYKGPGFSDRVRVNECTLLPEPDRLPEPEFQAEYVRLLMSLAHTGMSYASTQQHDEQPSQFKRGKRRPKGKRSRTPLLIDLYAPDADPNPRKRDAERRFERLLAVAWLELTGDEKPRKNPRYFDFIQVVFEQTGSDDIDVRNLINEARRHVEKYNRQYAAAKKKAQALVQMLPPVEGLLSAADGIAVDGINSRLRVKNENPENAGRSQAGSHEIILRKADVRAIAHEIVSEEQRREAALETEQRKATRARRKQKKSEKT